MKNKVEELIAIAEKLKSKNVPLFSYKFELGFKNPATIGDKVYFTEEHTDEEKKILEHLKLVKFWIEEDKKVKENLHKPVQPETPEAKLDKHYSDIWYAKINKELK